MDVSYLKMKRQINFNRKRSEKTETREESIIKKYQHSQCCRCTSQSPQQFFESKNLLSVYKDTTYKRRTRQISKNKKTKTKKKRMTDCYFSNKLTLKYRLLWCRLLLSWRPEWGWGREHDWKTGASMLHARVRLRLTQELENLPISPVLQANKAYLKDCCHHHK